MISKLPTCVKLFCPLITNVLLKKRYMTDVCTLFEVNYSAAIQPRKVVVYYNVERKLQRFDDLKRNMSLKSRPSAE